MPRLWLTLLLAICIAGCSDPQWRYLEGERLPQFTVTDTEGNAAGTIPWRGEVIVIGTIYVMEEPMTSQDGRAQDARGTIERMRGLHSTYAEQGVRFLTLGAERINDTLPDLKELKEGTGASWPFALDHGDAKYVVGHGYGINIVDRDGRLVVYSGSSRCLEEGIESALANEKNYEITC